MRTMLTCAKSISSSARAAGRAAGHGAEEFAPVAVKSAGTRIDQAFIGSCANGTLDDLALAARVLAGRKVSPQARASSSRPASQTVYREALRAGAIATLSKRARSSRHPTCGACGGGHMGVLGPERNVHHREHAQLQGPHGRPELEGLHGVAGDRRGFGDHGRHHRSPASSCTDERAGDEIHRKSLEISPTTSTPISSCRTARST